jgi:amidase
MLKWHVPGVRSDWRRRELVYTTLWLFVIAARPIVTGHPAISLPCGMEDGRPIGMMLVGRHYDECTIYRAAAAFEHDGDWTTS